VRTGKGCVSAASSTARLPMSSSFQPIAVRPAPTVTINAIRTPSLIWSSWGSANIVRTTRTAFDDQQ
jgi:hypothetical protein